MEVIKPMDFSSFSAFCEHLDKATKKTANTTTTPAAATATVTATTTPLIQATTANGVAGASSALAITPPPFPNLVNGNANNYHQYIEVLNDYDCSKYIHMLLVLEANNFIKLKCIK